MNAQTLKYKGQENQRHDESRENGSLRIVIAGGGTGGHLFPGIAIADEFITRDRNNRILFISTGNAFEKSVLSKTGFKLETITAEPIKGRGLFGQALSVLKLPKGIIESLIKLRRFRPDLVVGVGSYSAGPVVIGAWILGIKIVLHEQNILPGITNRILSRLADKIFVSFNGMKPVFSPEKQLVSGNPVRKEILQLSQCQENGDVTAGNRRRPFSILILGGSQGAHRINTAVIEALAHLNKRERFNFVHQAGPQDIEQVKNAHSEYGISGTVKSFFGDMPQQYQRADLIICRAGATTIAEVTAVGKGVIFIPFPFAADNHQALNARMLMENGAAEMVLQQNLSGELLAKKIEYYAANPEALRAMGSKAKSFGKPDAAQMIVNNCYGLFERN